MLNPLKFEFEFRLHNWTNLLKFCAATTYHKFVDISFLNNKISRLTFWNILFCFFICALIQHFVEKSNFRMKNLLISFYDRIRMLVLVTDKQYVYTIMLQKW